MLPVDISKEPLDVQPKMAEYNDDENDLAREREKYMYFVKLRTKTILYSVLRKITCVLGLKQRQLQTTSNKPSMSAPIDLTSKGEQIFTANKY